jgi:AcrR family transcriptional regulator
MREDIETHMDAMFDGEDLTEDFKTKAATIFEAALQERVDTIQRELQEEYQSRLVDEVDDMKKGLTEQLDSYLSYVVEEWMEENRLVVEKGIRTEIAEEFMQGLRNLFLEHDISVPENKIDLTDQLAETVENIKSQLDEEMNKNIELKSEIAKYRRSQILDEASADLADTQKERFAVLAEGITFETEDDLRKKAQIIKESYFNYKKPILREEAIATSDEGSIDEVATPATDTLSESMASYAQTLSRLNRR